MEGWGIGWGQRPADNNLLVEIGERRDRRAVFYAGCAVLTAAAIAGSYAVALGHGLTPNGIKIF